MNAFTTFHLAEDADQRRHPRFPVALPAMVTTRNAQASALIRLSGPAERA